MYSPRSDSKLAKKYDYSSLTGKYSLTPTNSSLSNRSGTFQFPKTSEFPTNAYISKTLTENLPEYPSKHSSLIDTITVDSVYGSGYKGFASPKESFREHSSLIPKNELERKPSGLEAQQETLEKSLLVQRNQELEMQISLMTKRLKKAEDAKQTERAHVEKIYEEIIRNLSKDKLQMISQLKTEFDQNLRANQEIIESLFKENEKLEHDLSPDRYAPEDSVEFQTEDENEKGRQSQYSRSSIKALQKMKMYLNKLSFQNNQISIKFSRVTKQGKETDSLSVSAEESGKRSFVSQVEKTPTRNLKGISIDTDLTINESDFKAQLQQSQSEKEALLVSEEKERKTASLEKYLNSLLKDYEALKEDFRREKVLNAEFAQSVARLKQENEILNQQKVQAADLLNGSLKTNKPPDQGSNELREEAATLLGEKLVLKDKIIQEQAQRLKEVEAAGSEFAAELKDARIAINKLDLEQLELKNENTRLSHELESLKTQQAHQGDKKESDRALEKFKHEISSLTTDLAARESLVASLKISLSQKDAEIVSLESRGKEAKDRLGALQKQVNDLEVRNSELTAELQLNSRLGLENQIELLKEQLNKHQENEALITKLEGDNQFLTDTLDQKSQEAIELHHLLETKSQAVVSLQSKLHDEEMQAIQKKAELEKLKGELHSREFQLQGKEEQIKVLQNTYEEEVRLLKSEKQDLMQEFDLLQEAHAQKQRSDLHEYQNRIKEIEEKTMGTAEEITSQMLKEKIQENEELNNELEDLREKSRHSELEIEWLKEQLKEQKHGYEMQLQLQKEASERHQRELINQLDSVTRAAESQREEIAELISLEKATVQEKEAKWQQSLEDQRREIIHEYQEKLASKSHEIDNWRVSVKILEDKLGHETQNSKQLNHKLSQLISDFDSKLLVLARLEIQKMQLEQENKELCEENAKLRLKVSEITEKNVELDEELKQARAKETQLEKEKLTLVEVLESTTTKDLELEKENLALLKDLQEQKEERLDCLKDIVALQEETRSLKQKEIQLKQENLEIAEEIEISKKRGEYYESNSLIFERELEEVQKRSVQLENENHSLAVELEKVKGQQDTKLQETIRELEEKSAIEIHKYNQECETKSQQITELTAQIKEETETMKQFYHSLSHEEGYVPLASGYDLKTIISGLQQIIQKLYQDLSTATEVRDSAIAEVNSLKEDVSHHKGTAVTDKLRLLDEVNSSSRLIEELTEKIRSVEVQRNEARSELEVKQEELESARSAKQSIDQELRLIEEKLATALDENHNLRHELNGLNQRLKAQIQADHELSTSFSNLKSEYGLQLAEAEQTVEVLRKENEQLLIVQASAKENNKNLQEEIDSVLKTLEAQSEALKAKDTQIAHTELENQRLTVLLKELENNFDEEKTQLESLKQAIQASNEFKVQNLTFEAEKMRSSLEMAQNRVKELENDLENHKSRSEEMAKVLVEAEQLKASKTSVEHELEAAEQQKKEMEARVNELDQMVKSQGKDRQLIEDLENKYKEKENEYKTEISSLKDAIENATKQESISRGEAKELREKLELINHGQASNEELQKQIKEKDQLMDELQERIIKLTNEATRLQNAHQSRLEELENQIAAKDQYLVELQNQVQEFESNAEELKNRYDLVVFERERIFAENSQLLQQIEQMREARAVESEDFAFQSSFKEQTIEMNPVDQSQREVEKSTGIIEDEKDASTYNEISQSPAKFRKKRGEVEKSNTFLAEPQENEEMIAEKLPDGLDAPSPIMQDGTDSLIIGQSPEFNELNPKSSLHQEQKKNFDWSTHYKNLQRAYERIKSENTQLKKEFDKLQYNYTEANEEKKNDYQPKKKSALKKGASSNTLVKQYVPKSLIQIESKPNNPESSPLEEKQKTEDQGSNKAGAGTDKFKVWQGKTDEHVKERDSAPTPTSSVSRQPNKAKTSKHNEKKDVPEKAFYEKKLAELGDQVLTLELKLKRVQQEAEAKNLQKIQEIENNFYDQLKKYKEIIKVKDAELDDFKWNEGVRVHNLKKELEESVRKELESAYQSLGGKSESKKKNKK